MIEAELPDGRVLEFPDGTDPQVIQRVVKSQLSVADTPQPTGGAPGAGERFVQGVKDPLYGMAQFAAHTAPDWLEDAGMAVTNLLDRTFGLEESMPVSPPELDARIAQQEADYQARRGPDAGFDWVRLGGNVAGTLPAALAAPATVPGAIGAGVVAGGMMPVTDGGDDYWTDKAIQGGTGAAGGLAGNLIGRGASRVIAPKVKEGVKALMDRGVTPTPGQILGGGAKAFEEKMTSVPILGDVIKGGQARTIEQFNTAVYDDILRPLGVAAPKRVGRNAVVEVGDAISRGYDDLLNSGAVFRLDRQLANDVQTLRTMVGGLPAKEGKQFTAFLRDKVAKAFGPNGMSDGRTFKELESALAKEAAQFAKSGDAYQQKLGQAYGELLTALRDGFARSNAGRTVTVGGKSVDAGQRLQDLNLAWAKLVRLEKAAGSQGAPEGVFTPAQLSSAVKAADQSTRKRAYSRGASLMQDMSDQAKDVIGNVYPDSGTAGRLAAMLMTGGAGFVSPYAAAAGAVPMLPYTAPGQRLAAMLLAQRPSYAPQVADTVRRAVPALQAAGAAAASNR